MITRMLQVDGARISVGTAPVITSPLSFLPVGVRGGDSLTFNGTTLPVSQLVSQLFHLTMQASDTIALKLKVPTQSIENMEGSSPIPVKHIPLRLKIGSAAGSVNGVRPMLVPSPSSMSMSTLAVDEEVILDGIPVILGSDVYVDVSDITIVSSRLLNVPYVTISLDALIIPTWISERSVDEWLGKTPITGNNSTDALNTSQLNLFLQSGLGRYNDLQITKRGGGVTAFELYSPDTQRRAEFLMTLPSSAVMVAFQRVRHESPSDPLPDTMRSLGWNPNWRGFLSTENTPGTSRRSSLLVASSTVSANSISFHRYETNSGVNTGPVQFLILYNQEWPEEGLPADDPRLELRVLAVPRLATSSFEAVRFDADLDLTLAGRDFTSDPSPFNQSVASWTKGAHRAAVFSSGVLHILSACNDPRAAWNTEVMLPVGEDWESVNVPFAAANIFMTAIPSGNVLAVTSSGQIGSTSRSTGRMDSAGMYIHFPILVSWAANC